MSLVTTLCVLAACTGRAHAQEPAAPPNPGISTPPDPHTVPALVAVDDSPHLFALMTQDVFLRYGLYDQFRSELERKTFQSSPEYAAKLAELKKERAEALTQEYFLVVEGKIGNYNVSTGTFDVDLGFVGGGLGTIGARPPKSVQGFLFPTLPIVATSAAPLLPAPIKIETLRIAVPEGQALALERMQEQLQVRLAFKIVGLKDVQYPYLNVYYSGQMESLNISGQTVSTTKVRLVLWDPVAQLPVWERAF